MLFIYVFGSLFLQYITKKEFGSNWILIFHHNSTGNVYFSNLNECKQSLDFEKYSIFQTLDDSFKVDGCYEFLLQYPEISGYNRWKQLNNPILESKSGKTQVTGYQGIHIDWSGWYWGGLAVSTSTYCCIDGSIATGNWWYSIGAYYGNSYVPKFPGPGYSLTDDIRATEVFLWVKSNKNINERTIEKSRKISSSLLPIMLFTLICDTNINY